VRVLLLDNEAITALRDPRHPKQRRVLAHLEAIVSRRQRGDDARIVVPTAVRVESGWDRTQPGSAAINRLRVTDHPLDRATADKAAGLVTRARVSVADAHLGAVISSLVSHDVIVLTSDPADIRRVAEPAKIRIIQI
jgi:hypothetical protein